MRLMHGDCLELMKEIPDGSVDLVLCDLPYGLTACSWDSVLPLDVLWKEWERIVKSNGIIVLFGTEPFSTSVRSSNLKRYKYDWIWKKPSGTGFVRANSQPLRDYETEYDGLRYPKQILQFSYGTDRGYHPTQKPVPLLEYLIRTYTNPGETVLDNCMGSGSTGVACVNTGRDFLGIEKDDKYFRIAEERIAKAEEEQMLAYTE